MHKIFAFKTGIFAAALLAAVTSVSAQQVEAVFAGAGVVTEATRACERLDDRLPPIFVPNGSPVRAALKVILKGPEVAAHVGGVMFLFGDGSVRLVPARGAFATSSFARILGTTMSVQGVEEWIGEAQLTMRPAITETTTHTAIKLKIRHAHGLRGCDIAVETVTIAHEGFLRTSK